MIKSIEAYLIANWRGTVPPVIALAVFYAVFLSFVSPNIVIAKLHADSFVYFAQAQYLAQHGTLKGLTIGDGFDPVVYAPVAAYVRAPLFLIFRDIDTVIRAIHVQNVAILAFVGLLSREYLRLRMPANLSLAWSLAPFVWLCVRYDPWLKGAFLPSSDQIFAALEMSFIVLCLHHKWWLKTPIRTVAYGALLLSILTVATVQKITALALLVYMATYFSTQYKLSRPHLTVFAGVLIAWVLIMVVATHGLITHYIQAAWAHYFVGRSITDILGTSAFTLLASAIPAQIIPNWSYAFHRPGDPTASLELFNAQWQWLPLTLVSAVIVAIFVLGVWRARRRLTPEIICLACIIPIYALSTNATARYLSYTQPLIFVLFLDGLPKRLEIWWRSIGTMSKISATITTALGMIILIYLFILSTTRINSVRGVIKFGKELDSSFRAARIQIGRITDEGGTFVASPTGDLRWFAVVGAEYVTAGHARETLCQGRPVYYALTCDRRNCAVHTRDQAETIHNVSMTVPIKTRIEYTLKDAAADVVITRLLLDNSNARCNDAAADHRNVGEQQ